MIMDKDGSGKDIYIRDLKTEHAKVSPDGTKILYSIDGEILVYNLADGTKEIIISKEDLM